MVGTIIKLDNAPCMFKSRGSGARLCWFELCYLGKRLTHPCLSWVLCKIGIIIGSYSKVTQNVLNIYWKDWCWSSNTVATWCEEQNHWKRPWCWERLKAGGEGGDRGWDGWMASLSQWTWGWANCGRQWRTGRPGVLPSMGLEITERNRTTVPLRQHTY